MSPTTINLQLVESLIGAVQALSPAEQSIVRSALSLPQGSRLSPDTDSQIPKQSVLDILNETPRSKLFQTPEEVDQHLQQERASWDS
jgi:hypothetical protein